METVSRPTFSSISPSAAMISPGIMDVSSCSGRLDRRAAFGFQHALCRGRKFIELGCWPDRPAHQFATAIGAAAIEHVFHAIEAEGAFEAADHRLAAAARQILLPAFAIGSKLKHGDLSGSVRGRSPAWCHLGRSPRSECRGSSPEYPPSPARGG